MAVVAGVAGLDGVRARRFYLVMSVIVASVAFVGFAPTYWVPLLTGSLSVPPAFHVHGSLFFAWSLFLVLQASLVAAGHTARHRELGMAGIALATAMVFSGVLAAIRSMILATSLGAEHAGLVFSVVPLTAIVFFAGVFGYAVANVRRPDVHRRAVMLASISLLQAAVARWFQLFLAEPGAISPPPVAVTIGPGLLSDLLIVALAIHDWRTRCAVHRVYVVGGLALLALQLARVPLGETSGWLAIAEWCRSLAG